MKMTMDDGPLTMIHRPLSIVHRPKCASRDGEIGSV